MEDGLTLFDYEVGLNDIIQLLVKSEASAEEQSENCEDRVNDLKERRNSDDVHAPSYNIRPSSKVWTYTDTNFGGIVVEGCIS